MSSYGHVYSTSLSSSLQSPSDVQGMLLTRLDSTPTTSTKSTTLSRRAARRTLSVLSGLPTEISALIRSHSVSSARRHSKTSDTDVHMGPDDDRPSRKSRFENKIYNFLTRSRSRSRSKSGRVPSVEPHEPVPDLPLRIRNDAGPPVPSKPPSRIQSRPLSSTTTATNTTVTPGTPRPRKRPSAIPVPVSPRHSRPETPKASGTRKTLHNLFGIPLSSPKRSSFSSSRRNSPRASLEIQEQNDYDPTPKPHKSYSPHPNSRAASPTPHSRHPVHNSSLSSTGTSSTSASSRIHKFFKGHKTPPRTAPSPDLVSGPLRRPAQISHHRHSSSESTHLRLPSPDPQLSHSTKATTGPPLLPPPTIIHTPATPLKPDKSRPDMAPSTAVHEQNLGARKQSLDSRYRHRTGERMAVVDETGVMRGTGRGKDRDLGMTNGSLMVNGTRTNTRGTGTTSRSTKHGSFDFERPGWSAAGVIQRTGSAGTTESGATDGGWGRSGSLGGIRESAMGPGLAGVGTLQRDQSMKRAREREDMIMRAREDERKRREMQKEMQHSPSRGTPLPDTDENGVGTSTSTTGKISSLGRKRGGLLRDASFRGKSRPPLGATHGRFPFEPPVSPTRSTGSTNTNGGADSPISVSWAGGTELQKENTRLKTELEREKHREKERKHQSHHPQRETPVPVPVPGIGHRSGTKGRSLDLGLGLAWAPAKLRENALLPTSGYFARSVSGASSALGQNRSVSGSTNSVSKEEDGGKGGSKVAREVADVFRNALDDEGYADFKKYVHRFDAHDIPFDGPNGIVARVERLLRTAPDLGDEGKKHLLDSFVRIVLQNA